MREQRNWTAQDVDFLTANYSSVPFDNLVAHFNRSRASVRGMARILRLKSKRSIATEAIEHSYFSIIDTTEKAYVLGLLASDGSIDPSGQVRLYLHKKDEDLVAWVRDRISPLSPLHPHGNAEAVGVRITSQQFVKDLATYGIVPRKSYSYQFPSELPKQFVRSFLLGYFDGDGSLCYVKRGTWKPGVRWYLYGQYDFLRSVVEIIERETGIVLRQPRQPRENRVLFAIQTSDKKARQIDEWLNQDFMGLKRKHL